MSLLPRNIMKSVQLFIALAILAVFSFGAKAQDTPIPSPEYLGEWCTIDIDLTNDPVTPRGELIYEIPDPPEGAGLMGYNDDNWIEYGNIPMTGPGNPYVIKNVSTLECHFRKKTLELDMLDGGYAIFVCDLPVKKTVVIIGSRPTTYKQCFYTVRVTVKE